ncbi:MAG: apolipoprotein N-acyltransferase [Sulfuriflexus sp.]|nr:apolipoprotein N-acyltransferase [Sulfuriflexus sp.]
MIEINKQARIKDGLVILAGVLMVTGYAPFSFLPSSIFALFALLWLLQNIGARRAAWRGFLFGLGLFGAGTSWVVISIHEFGHTPLPLALFLTILLVAYLSLFPALFAWLVVRFRVAEQPLVFLFMTPALWAGTEWLRGTLFTGFPWLNIGYSQVDTWLVGYAPVIGVYGLGFLLMLSVTATLLILRRKQSAVVLLAIIWFGGWSLQSIEWATPAGKSLQVSLMQGNVSQLDKFRPEKRANTMSLYEELTLDNLDSDLIVWPETAVPAFYHQVAENYISDILQQTREQGVDLLIGAPVKQVTADSERPNYYNSAIALGKEFGVYHKRHLVPFGEVVPFGDLLRKIGGIFNVPLSDFSTGGLQAPLNLAGQKAAVSICYEIVFGEELAQTAGDATMLINISNDAWFGDSLAPPQHFSMARMRVKETARPLLRATNTGITAFVDHRGVVTHQAPSFSVQVLRGSIQPMQGKTPYVRFGNTPILWLIGMLILVGGFILRRRQQGV